MLETMERYRLPLRRFQPRRHHSSRLHPQHLGVLATLRAALGYFTKPCAIVFAHSASRATSFVTED